MRTATRSHPATSGRQLALFGAVSVGTTLLDFGLFNVMVLLSLATPVAANTVSYAAGIVTSYLLNKHLTFRGGGRDKRSQEFVLFVALNLVGLGLSNIAVAAAAWMFGRSALFLNSAKLLAGASTWVLKFLGFKRWVYPMPSPTAGESRREQPIRGATRCR